MTKGMGISAPGSSLCARSDGHMCYKETQWLGMYTQSETREGTHRRHTRTRNANLPTQDNNIEFLQHSQKA